MDFMPEDVHWLLSRGWEGKLLELYSQWVEFYLPLDT